MKKGEQERFTFDNGNKDKTFIIVSDRHKYTRCTVYKTIEHEIERVRYKTILIIPRLVFKTM